MSPFVDLLLKLPERLAQQFHIYIISTSGWRCGYVLARARRGRRALLALEAVKEAAGVVTLGVAAAVMKELPARHRGGAVVPWAEPAQRAVSSVPIALRVLTLWVAHLVAAANLTLQIRAGHGPDSDLAVLSAVAVRAAAKERVRFVQVFHAHASVLARTGRIFVLALWAREAGRADALQTAGGGRLAVSAVLTAQVGAGVALVLATVGARKALRES